MEPTVVDVEVVERGHQVRAMRVCAALVTAVFLAGIVGLAAVSPSHSWTPAQQLGRVRQFVQDARTAHFVGTSTWSSGTAKGELGTHFEHTSRAEGVLSLPGRSHWTEDQGDAAQETIVVPEGLFLREADTASALDLEGWKQYPHPSNELPLGGVPAGPVPPGASGPGIHVMVGQAGPVLSALGAPAEFTDVLAHLTNLTRVSPRVIRGTVDMASVPGLSQVPTPLPRVTIELAGDTTGRLERLLATSTGTMADEAFTARNEMRFTQWGAPVDVSAPTGDAVDKTPDIDEEGLAAFSAAPILIPGNLPAASQLTDASVTEAGAAGDCPEVDLTYGDPSQSLKNPDEVSSDINVTITPADCDQSALDGGDPVTIAGHSARIKHGKNADDEYAVTVEVVVGATRMTVDSDLPDSQILGALRTIVAFDIAKQHIYTAPSSSGLIGQ